jgi:hypothetical protein
MTTRGKTTQPATFRPGELLQIGRETVTFGRNTVAKAGTNFTIQHRFFVNDPWELIAEGIHRALPSGRTRDIAHSFRRQAEDYFQAATIAREIGVRPVLLYYAFLNLSKAYAISKGNSVLGGKSAHGIGSDWRPQAIATSSLRFERTSANRPGVFQELLKQLNGSAKVLSSNLSLGHLLPQILPGHRLWCYATNRPERFVSVEKFEIRHDPAARLVWLNVFLAKNDLDRLDLSDTDVMTRAGLAKDFESLAYKVDVRYACFQQRYPETYISDPGDALTRIMSSMSNRVWETVKITSPYRKPYLYCCPASERRALLPQMLSIYLLMFFLGSVTRYSPLYFEDLFETRYGPFFETFVSESSMQFLYLMASEILGREVSRPAII